MLSGIVISGKELQLAKASSNGRPSICLINGRFVIKVQALLMKGGIIISPYINAITSDCVTW